jgi:hypothetical protein
MLRQLAKYAEFRPRSTACPPVLDPEFLVGVSGSVNVDMLATANKLLDAQPSVLLEYAERFWSKRQTVTADPLGYPSNRSVEVADPVLFLTSAPPKKTRDITAAEIVRQSSSPFDFIESTSASPPRWDHLIYAYMIENTRVKEIFRRVVYEYRHGEKLGAPIDGPAQQWLRTTEELFYSYPTPLSILNVGSRLRDGDGQTRRNAYQRMFGMDLNHGQDDGKPFEYVKAQDANTEFVATFEQLLREVWIAITFVKANAAANPTDNAKIIDLVRTLKQMMLTRRQAGNLSREEFAAVTAMSWFHLTLSFNTPIVKSLRAESEGPENRLFKIAARVGLPAHGLSRSFFEIADPISTVLTQIESGFVVNARQLYDPVPDPLLPEMMQKIASEWSTITSRNLKQKS